MSVYSTHSPASLSRAPPDSAPTAKMMTEVINSGVVRDVFLQPQRCDIIISRNSFSSERWTKFWAKVLPLPHQTEGKAERAYVMSCRRSVFWLTVWYWGWKLAYRLVCGGAETFMLNKRRGDNSRMKDTPQWPWRFTQLRGRLRFQKKTWRLIKWITWVPTTYIAFPRTVTHCFEWAHLFPPPPPL